MMQRAPALRTPRMMRLLIATDAPELVQDIRHVLRLNSRTVVLGVAGSGDEAIQQAIALKPDVLLLDLDMVDVDGLQVTQALSSQVQTSVVLLSVHDEPAYLLHTLQFSARGYLIKPLTDASFHLLLKHLAKILGIAF